MNDNRNNIRIKVFGIGGGGSNTIDYIKENLSDNLMTYSLNTDDQALKLSKADKKIRLGKVLTKGLGAGAIPEIGARAAEESQEEIKKELENTDILFIAAGMGGGTGTGAAPKIASYAKEMGILTFGVVTTPFDFEGKKRMEMALEGAKLLEQEADVCIMISNQSLIKNHGDKFIEDAFSLSDSVLKTDISAVIKAITTKSTYTKSFDLNAIKENFTNAGVAVLGIESSDEHETIMENLHAALEKSIESDMLDISIHGAQKFIFILTLDEENAPGDASDYPYKFMKNYLGYDISCDVAFDLKPDYGNKVEVTMLATKFKDQETSEKIFQNKQENNYSDIFFDGL